MSKIRKLGLSALIIILIVTSSIGGIVIGTVLAGDGENNLFVQLKIFNEVLTYVTKRYVDEDKINPEDLIRASIDGMLSSLDPHSVYMDPKKTKDMQEEFRGEFFGIGIYFDVVDAGILVVAPVEGTPSDRLGIRAGDIIAKIEDESCAGITTEQVYTKLRGPKGSKVHVSIHREGQEELLELDIIRDEIPIYSVPYWFMIRDDIGYVRIIRFAQNTDKELEQALSELEEQGMKKFILDLRFNTGGLLSAAVAVSDKFIDENKMLVYTKGRIPSANKEYHSTSVATHPNYPIIVLMNQGSASASEIVSGAIQDWDRGIVVGTSSFGKGLVQNQFPLRNQATLLLTVAKYYTPTGRCIQRDYSKGTREYYLEILENKDSEEMNKDKPKYETLRLGRTVYGGGGITPDYWVASETRLTASTSRMLNERIFITFATTYCSKHPELGNDFDIFLKDFEIDETIINQFHSSLDETDIEYTDEDFEKDLKYIKIAIKKEIAIHFWDTKKGQQVLIETDQQLLKSLEYFPEAEALFQM